jgi:hypothetical protein
MTTIKVFKYIDRADPEEFSTAMNPIEAEPIVNVLLEQIGALRLHVPLNFEWNRYACWG